MVACCGFPQGAWELGSQREDQDLSVAWGLDGLLWLSPGRQHISADIKKINKNINTKTKKIQKPKKIQKYKNTKKIQNTKKIKKYKTNKNKK